MAENKLPEFLLTLTEGESREKSPHDDVYNVTQANIGTGIPTTHHFF